MDVEVGQRAAQEPLGGGVRGQDAAVRPEHHDALADGREDRLQLPGARPLMARELAHLAVEPGVLHRLGGTLGEHLRDRHVRLVVAAPGIEGAEGERADGPVAAPAAAR